MPNDPDHTPADDLSYGLNDAANPGDPSAGHPAPSQAAPPIAAARVVYCTHCGVQLDGLRIGEPCPNCATPVGSGAQAGRSNGKAIAALVLGICSIVGCLLYGLPGIVCGILAIIFARKARFEIEAGHLPPSAAGMARAGSICGIVGLSLSILYALLMIGWFVFFFGYMMPNQMQSPMMNPPPPTHQTAPATPTQPAPQNTPDPANTPEPADAPDTPTNP